MILWEPRIGTKAENKYELSLEQLTKAKGKKDQIDPDTGEKVLNDEGRTIRITERVLSPSKAAAAINSIIMLRSSERDNVDKAKIWRYDGGIWKPDGEREIVKIIDAALGDLSHEKGLREMLRRIRLHTAIALFDDNPCLFPVLDGVVDLNTGAFRAAMPEDYLTFRYAAVFYNPTADCRPFLWFLCTSLPDSRDVLTALDIVVAISIRIPLML